MTDESPVQIFDWPNYEERGWRVEIIGYHIRDLAFEEAHTKQLTDWMNFGL